ncbi:esterase [Haemophilus paracuniculus]|uniref:Esterase n=1 Tax=Haemophilus paracuniculus TaxID=734 RepID=A0A1T0AQP8_9PAST|nr:hotdog fold thioesterase [Haemophilus paracuniculus]OOR98401.1 esterase [Haemophilus paracuniculus]
MNIMWHKNLTLAELNEFCQHSAVAHLGIEFTQIGDNYLEATVPVDNRTTQPFGLLHGGISATLAETLGSAAAFLSCEGEQIPVGIELNISHIKAIKQGFATARATPLHLGRDQQLWQIEQRNPQGDLCAISRLTVRLITPKS